jgi:hypothetical protein
MITLSNRTFAIWFVVLLGLSVFLVFQNYNGANGVKVLASSNELPPSSSQTGLPAQPISDRTNTPKPALKDASLPFRWKPVESADYKVYIQNLRKLSFPEPLIREMIVADINKLYEPREEALRWHPAPPDASLEERRKQPTLEDLHKIMQLRDVEIEKQAVLEQLLGVHIPREFIRTPNSRNYEAYEYAISQLPIEKQEAVQRLAEDEVLSDDLNQTKYGGYGSKEETAEYRALNDKISAAMQKILTPDEYQRYLMNSSPPGTEMARRIIGMEPTDEEMLKIWKLTHEQWEEQGGVYGRWRAEHRSQQEVLAADEKLAKGLRDTLGQDRYIDYQMAVSDTGQQMRNFANRYSLPRETLTTAFELQTQLDQMSATQAQLQKLGATVVFNSPGTPSPEQTFANLRQRLLDTLGPDLLNKWNTGRSLKYNVQPEAGLRPAN